MSKLVEVKNLKQYFRVGGSLLHPMYVKVNSGVKYPSPSVVNHTMSFSDKRK